MRFAKFLKAKLGKEDGFDDDIMAEAMEQFEKKIKRQFTLGAAPEETYTIPVGGLANNKELGISRGRFALKASDLQTIFEPVVLECIKLVKDQITASNTPIRAVLLVGGFGASHYLKERLRNAIDKNIQIMQPPNAWQAVVQGAVMKGLAQVSPDRLTQVRVQNRKARKHYGTEWRTKYDVKAHKHLEQRRHWCGLDGCYKVYTMEWFIQRGDNVSENEPFYTSFVWTGLVSQGRIKKIKMDVYADRNARAAPVARDDNVSMLVHVEADVSHIPEHMLARRKGLDGQWYYELSCKIEAVYLSASTAYTLLYNNQRYSTVTAETTIPSTGSPSTRRLSPSSVTVVIKSLELGLMYILNPVACGLADAYGPARLYSVAALSAVLSRRRALAIGGVCLPVIISHLVPRLCFEWTLRIAALISLGCYAVAVLISTPKHPGKPVKSVWSVADFSGFPDRRYFILALANVAGNFGLYIPFYYLGTFRAPDEPDAALPVSESSPANPAPQSVTLRLATPSPRSGNTTRGMVTVLLMAHGPLLFLEQG
ncbi:hypothetical protein CH063_12475 [Colletotrichum higginsianum]|uniref:Hsp70-like protein n=1 Tax=Colletotrichum higginsianum (strain IMI 349063) TaxID=759273 RepID=H1VQI9_COLHI|nr:hypothetical protein CH063_12475 [Colletotrichum higginsianum]